MTDLTTLPASYSALLEELKGHIRAAQVQAAFAVNRELIFLYWLIGRKGVLSRPTPSATG
jgi:hypothetical protein